MKVPKRAIMLLVVLSILLVIVYYIFAVSIQQRKSQERISLLNQTVMVKT